MARYDIRQVTRYVLVRKPATEYAGSDMDVAEFRRHDEALKALRSLSGTIYPAETTAQDACIRINGDIAITLVGIEVLNTTDALDLLESRVATAKKIWQRKREEAV